MLLENNTNKVINLIYQFDDLSNIDKVRLAIYLLENKYFNVSIQKFWYISKLFFPGTIDSKIFILSLLFSTSFSLYKILINGFLGFIFLIFTDFPLFFVLIFS